MNTGLDEQLVDFEEEGVKRVLIAEEEVLDDMHEMVFNKWLTAVQCALAPLSSVAVLVIASSPDLLFKLSSANFFHKREVPINPRFSSLRPLEN